MYYNQKSNSKKVRWVILAVVLLLVGIAVFGFVRFSSVASNDQTTVVHSPEVVEVSEQQEVIPDLPVRLVIPAIGVDANIQYVGLDPEGTGEMDVPSNFTDVGWYKLGIRPGMIGSAVIAGHFNGKEIPEAVFYDLDTLQVGDKVVVMGAEQVLDIFQVVKIKTFNYADSAEEVFVSTDGKVRLNLITCGGDWLSDVDMYDTRIVVFTERVINM